MRAAAFRSSVATCLAVVLSGCALLAGTDRATAPAVPGIPTNVIALAGDSRIRVFFSAPAAVSGSLVEQYTVTCLSAGIIRTQIGSASPITVIGLANGTSYSCSVTAGNVSGSSAASVSASATPLAPGTGSSAFTVTSSAFTNGGVLPATYTCDGTGSSPALTWTNAPAGTAAYAVQMTTLPGDGTTKWNWVLHSIPATITTLPKDSYGVGIAGVGNDGPTHGYQPPCSQGAGARVYTITVYALSALPALPVAPNQITGRQVSDAILSLTLATAAISVSYTRATYATAAQCLSIRTALGASTGGVATASCDSTYAFISGDAVPTHAMMMGITTTNLQVPIGQTFFGDNAWRIPLSPAVAATPTPVTDGPIGVAINGVPIFSACDDGGCQNGDAKARGELDDCNGHAGRSDDYHYHAAPSCLMAGHPASYWDTHPVGWALDGFPIFGSNDATGISAVRDSVCGGNTKVVPDAPPAYSYHVSDVAPYVLTCFRGTPSPDLATWARRYTPLRPAPASPFPNTAMTLTTDLQDGYQVLQFASPSAFTTTANGIDSVPNVAGTYRVRYAPVTGAALTLLLAQSKNAGKAACWSFQFTSGNGAVTQPPMAYCR